MIGRRYELEREIGRGGMGAVWLAHDTSLDRHVAMKRLGLEPDTATPDARRAEREAILGAKVNHPHVVTVLDLVPDRDNHWLVMEYVGGSLAARIKDQGPLAPDEAAPLLAQAADALAAAHAAGIVHRDVKPSNLLIAASGDVKLSDFGVARGEGDATLTATGLVTGSPAYLAPEVARGGAATPASDMWALGATLVHAVTGEPPYHVDQSNPLSTLYRIAHDPPPRPREAGWLDPLVVGTMTHDPAARWTAAEARDFLRTGRPTHPLDTVAATSPAPGPAPAGAPTMIAPTPSGASPRGSGSRTAGILAAVAVGLLSIAASVAIYYTVAGSGSDPSATATNQAGSTPGATTPSADSGPTDEGIRTFVETYLRLVDDDPRQAFTMLTPQFQEDSGELEGYLGWWNQVDNTELIAIRPDAENLRVSYDYRYDVAGSGSRTETVSLQLEYDGENYLIAGEA